MDLRRPDVRYRLAVAVLALLFLGATSAEALPLHPLVFRALLILAAALAFSDRLAAATILVTIPLLGVYWSNGQFSLPLAAVAGEVYRQLRQGRLGMPRLVPLDAAVGLFVIAGLVSVPFALDPRLSLAVSARVLVLVTTYFFVSRAMTRPEHARAVSTAFAVVAVFSALVGIAQATLPGLGVAYANPIPTGMAFPAFRATGLDENPNTFAVSLVLAVLVCVDAVLTAKSVRRAVPWVLGAVVLLVGIEVSFSRTAYVGVLTGAALLGWVRLPRLRTALVAAAATVAVVVASALLTGAAVRAASLADLTRNTSSMDRVYLSLVSVRIFRDYPLVGVGIGGFRAAYEDYSDPRVTVSPVTDPHQSTFSIPAESGVLALLSEIAVAAALVRALARARSAVRGGAVPAAGVPVAIAFLVMSLFAAQHFLHVFWIALAMAAAFSLNVRQADAGEDGEAGIEPALARGA